ncbi:hypothetical protein A3860_09095 [Niastella vici]|uniref:Uncharacterized protein n=1 Tax=Niastella vici TaxID=1703345 RepID=A0A1V9FHE3_9BACT|nr:hypothetical protein [Niastella vici]OQP57772.1 hypothetical protein A3860_09095 [Niastella vici]
MQRVKLRSVLGKSGILGVYLLFLLVQLNLKYTLPNASDINIVAAAGNDLNSAKSCKYISPSDKKLSVLQPQLNKRYFHQQVYQLNHLPKHIAVAFAVERKQFIHPVPTLQSFKQLHSPFRGPPVA